MNRTFPKTHTLLSDILTPVVSQEALGHRTLCHEEQLVVEAMPVHGRPRGTRRDHQQHRADAVVRVGAVLENIAGDGAEGEDLGVVLPVHLHRRWAAVGGHPEPGVPRTAGS